MAQKLVITFFFLFVVSFVFGQNVPVNELITVKIPDSGIKVAKDEIKTRAKYPALNTKAKGDFFKIASVYIHLNGFRQKVDKNYLEQERKGHQALFSLSPEVTYSSNIKKINNYDVLIVNYQYPDDRYGNYYLILLDQKRSASIRGTVEYKKDDRNNAALVLDSLLANIKFN